MKTLTSNKAFWLLLVICVVTILPFLGLPEYHTKGEPRESIVSYSMLESDNWILPRNNGGEIPYKPPFFHWTIAAVSTLNGGQVTEDDFPFAIGHRANLHDSFRLSFLRQKKRNGSGAAHRIHHLDQLRVTSCRSQLPGGYGADSPHRLCVILFLQMVRERA